jgi:hypothetical protein
MESVLIVIIIFIAYWWYVTSQNAKKQLEWLESLPDKVSDKFKITISGINDSIAKLEKEEHTLAKELLQMQKAQLEDLGQLLERFYYNLEKYKYSDTKRKTQIYQDYWQYVSTINLRNELAGYGIHDPDRSAEEVEVEIATLKALRDRLDSY